MASTSSKIVWFFITVSAYVMLRNMFFMIGNESLTDDTFLMSNAPPPIAAEIFTSHAAAELLRQFGASTHTLPRIEPAETQNRSLVVNEFIKAHPEKNNKNHTLLRANMSHVGEIVKKIQQEVNQGKVENPHPFPYIINCPKLCGNEDIFVLAYVHTAPDHYKRRMVIRQTWGKVEQYDVPMKLVFFMGVSKVMDGLNNTDSEKALMFESEQYGDIVQEGFLDTYHNLTYKGIAALKWITNYCSQAVFVLKTDDDIFVNTYTLLRYLSHLQKSPKNTQGLLMCAVWYGMPVQRTGKWKVTKEEWEEDYYPTYCSGSAFLLSTDVAIRLYEVSYHVPFFWVDDFYITGLLPLKAGNITHRQFLSTFVLNGDQLEAMFTGPQWYSYIFSHLHELNRIQAVWNTLTKLAKGEITAVIKTAQPGDLKKFDPPDF